MKKYLFKRILFSIFALLVVTGTVMFMVYNLIDNSTVLANDSLYQKKTGSEKVVYSYKIYREYGYIDYVDFGTWIANEADPSTEEYTVAVKAVQGNDKVNEYPQNDLCVKFVDVYKQQGFTVEWLKATFNRKGVLTSSGYLVATKQRNIFQRLGDYFSHFFTVETIWSVQDENLASGDRYIRWEWDKYSNMPALVGNGTTHKYLLYFDDKFPFIHQNLFHINLGKSRSYGGLDTTEVMLSRTGDPDYHEEILPKDLEEDNPALVTTTLDFHTVTYSKTVTSYNEEIYGAGNHYINALESKQGFTHLGNSFVIGLMALIISYALGFPIGIWMSRKKDKLPDKIGNAYIVFIIAVPSLAYIFMFAAIGIQLFRLPYKWAMATVPALAFILPTISLALPSAGGLMRWIRRYMIDQENADYVKFARSQGLTEKEIFSKHIFRNAMIYIVHGIPIDLLVCLTGAIITERVYGVPGIGGLLTNAINAYDNGVIIAATVFYTAISILALLLGDLLLAKYDPRVSFTEDRR